MTENKAAERTTITASDRTPYCPVERLSGTCGRPIHPAPAHDETRVCLMHSRDPQKAPEFQEEFDAILKAAAESDTVADFTGFVFPSANYGNREFPAKCSFSHAIFTRNAIFSGASFTQDAIFSGATFTRNAIFSDATFKQDAYFYAAEFTQEARFWRATFTREANFDGATFTQEANFGFATFKQGADFRSAKLRQKAIFMYAKFLASAVFRETKFRGDPELKSETEEHEPNDKVPGPIFCMAEFSHPEAIVFYKTYLGQALFHNCDVSRVTFSSVEWRRRVLWRTRVVWRTRKRTGKRMLFEQEVDLKDKCASALVPDQNSHDERDYDLIAELYRQLNKNYDERKDYSAAGDFHYGAMEMKCRHSRSRRPWVRRLHQHLGWAAWYKYASSYGESYLRPLWLLAAVLVAFMLLYPWAGLRTVPPAFTAVTQQATPAMPSTELSYCHFGEFVHAHPGPKWMGQYISPRWIGRVAFFFHSGMTTLAVASFQRDLGYEPLYPWGRALALVQLVLTSTLIALFLLALRRQFRR